MRRIWGVLLGVLTPAALLVAPVDASVQTASGDTCVASGAGTSYTLIITLPANAPPQGGFAFGAGGVKVTNIDIAGNPGTLSTASLPANTTGQWLLTTPPKAGESVTAVVATSGPVTGPFTVVAESSPPSSTFFDPISCAISRGTAVPSNAFTVNQHVGFDSTTGVWHLEVTVPGPGVLSGTQAVAAAASSGSKPVVAKSLVQTRRVVTKSAGKFTLTLRLTPTGTASFNKNGSVRIKLILAFSPKGGRSATKVLGLTLKK